MSRPLAAIADRPVARHLRNAAPLYPDCRQDPAQAFTLAEPFLACDALCYGARTFDLADSGRRAHLSDRLRFHRASIGDFDQRRRTTPIRASRTIGCEFF